MCIIPLGYAYHVYVTSTAAYPLLQVLVQKLNKLLWKQNGGIHILELPSLIQTTWGAQAVILLPLSGYAYTCNMYESNVHYVVIFSIIVNSTEREQLHIYNFITTWWVVFKKYVFTCNNWLFWIFCDVYWFGGFNVR